MAITDKLLVLEKKWPWAIGGVILSIVLWFGSLYISFYERKASISFVVRSEFNVLDIKEPIEELSILFKNQDLRKEKLNLKIIKLLIINDGEIDILQSYYDLNDAFAFSINSPSKIIQIKNVTSNSPYLRSKSKEILLLKSGIVILPHVIFEKKDYIAFDLVVIQPIDKIKTSLTISGKIAGIKAFEIRNESEKTTEPSILEKAFSGSFEVQALRIISYLVADLIVAVFVIVTFIFVGNKLNEATLRYRKKYTLSLPKELKDEPSLKWVQDYYISYGRNAIMQLERDLNDSNLLKKFMPLLLANSTPEKFTITIPTVDSIEDFEIERIYRMKDIVEKAFEDKLLHAKGNALVIDHKLVDLMKLLLKAKK
ncbi:hypothetical protein EHQ57_10190 [Leptospira wolffii]|uniref:hypothetical protein n=2 Tax=Leptospira wolffii TaxID=409998 RepID=UPI0010845E08|nr:hypothetical protein [Leptospira wolffii]TGK59193.1 hypothetical protein EHQ32_10380 [Leptospira wolffii]TGK71426.1 hypothetical protein EHQ35_14965 [Leptospira wolffii]TGL29297.1 hypothetical protein EHQ57_10190 [Leptospira wolffii]